MASVNTPASVTAPELLSPPPVPGPRAARVQPYPAPVTVPLVRVAEAQLVPASVPRLVEAQFIPASLLIYGADGAQDADIFPLSIRYKYCPAALHHICILSLVF